MENNLDIENATGKNVDGPNANRPLKYLTSTSIIGDKLENKIGETVGKINNIMIDVHSGIIEYVIIEFGGVFWIWRKVICRSL